MGYVGWSSYGGYASFSPHYRLGVEQIVGAKIVNSRGEVVEANPAILKGIRGAGGTLGVIVESTIQVYPLNDFISFLPVQSFTTTKTLVSPSGNMHAETESSKLRGCHQHLVYSQC